MKFKDLISQEEIDVAAEAGKRLAKIVSDINITQKQPTKKSSFGEYFKTTLPQPLSEEEKGT